MGIGPTSLIIILVIVLVIFGPSNLPKLGRIAGEWIRDFRAAKDQLPSGDDFSLDSSEEEKKSRKKKDNADS